MEDSERRKQVAYSTLKTEYALKDYSFWDVNPESKEAKIGYKIGVSLDWPGEREKVRRQFEKVSLIAADVAERYNLESICLFNVLMAGGVSGVLIGFKEKKKKFQ